MSRTQADLILFAKKAVAMVAAIGDSVGLSGATKTEIVLNDGSSHTFTIQNLIDEMNEISDEGAGQEATGDILIDFPLAKQNNNTGA